MIQKPDIFIAHAGEDKEEVARPLARLLQAVGFNVWFDEFSLTLGDSLRRSIERGLTECAYGVVVLSENFFAKEWPKRELDGLAARELSDNRKVILPVWHKIDAAAIAKCSTMLADRLGISTEGGLPSVVKAIKRVCDTHPRLETVQHLPTSGQMPPNAAPGNQAFIAINRHAKAPDLAVSALTHFQKERQHKTGIVIAEAGMMHAFKASGSVDQLTPSVHGQYATVTSALAFTDFTEAVDTSPQEIPPLLFRLTDGIWAIASIGFIENATPLRKMYMEAGAIFQTENDFEIVAHLISDPMFRMRPRRVARSLAELKGAFTIVILNSTGLFTARDSSGLCTAFLGKLGSASVVASDALLLQAVGAEIVRPVEPGELVVVDESGVHSSIFAENRH